ncbi:histone acetyltransferase MYST2 [Cordyceps javanica]|uniref:histone acetyltransferase n=1 Tax=Cordyceps javanica TaxID=43265 RepID=A0A545URW5_9HYPO|nr:histone acetyltransferase MYST2 [Cordyceps javanica]TQW03995.1 histone acetyltransferase MYST2 [Cordyceps javanica]
MPPKRRRPGEAAPATQPATSNLNPSVQSPVVTRAATRQTPIYPPSIPITSPPKTTAVAAAPVATPVPLPIVPGQAPSPPKLGGVWPRSSPVTRVPPPPVPSAPGPAQLESSPLPSRNARAMGADTGKENARPSGFGTPETTYHVAFPHQQGRLSTSSLANHHGYLATASRVEMASSPSTVTPVLPPKPPTLAAAGKPPLSADRNIDKVVFGNLCFKTWYPSYYGKEVLGDTSGNARNGTKDHATEAGKNHGRKEREQPPMLERLYVCPSCFKGRRKIRVAHDGKGPGPKKRRGDGGMRYTEQIVQDEGEWSVWEVDGEVDGLFCQNLSLFAKLFLDNKSVFFDVTGFNYFLLVYTPPFKPPVGNEVPEAPVPQVTGFFSKEKMSWDNNNLACILVFPPWQRKGLGALLMGISYEISRREGILGGPEKPISDLGKKGYKRFWSGEIARWLLGLEVPQIPPPGMELMVDVNDCSDATWITPEDCLGVLRDMGLLEDAGVGPGKPIKREDTDEAEGDEEAAKVEEANNHEHAEEKTKKKKHATPVPPPLAPKSPVHLELGKPVPRVRVDKEQIRRYVTQHRISLEKTCDPAGFAEGYALKTQVEMVE